MVIDKTLTIIFSGFFCFFVQQLQRESKKDMENVVFVLPNISGGWFLLRSDETEDFIDDPTRRNLAGDPGG
jgi:hypothetical protein